MLKALEEKTIIDDDNIKRDLRRDGASEPIDVSNKHRSREMLSIKEAHKKILH